MLRRFRFFPVEFFVTKHDPVPKESPSLSLPLLLFALLNVDPGHAGAAIQVLMDITGVLLTCVTSTLILGFFERGELSSQVPSSPIVLAHMGDVKHF